MPRRLTPLTLTVICLLCHAARAAEKPPTDNPAAAYQLAWTNDLKWANVVLIHDMAGADWDQKTAAAQKQLAAQGGGVIYFPAGSYDFKDHIILQSGVILRGATPAGATDARNEKYDPPTRLNFPRYQPRFEGAGTPNDTAFKGIALAEPTGVSQCGVVNVSIDNGHVDLSDQDFSNSFVAGRCGKGRIVYGCVLRNAAVLDASIPKLKDDLDRPFQEAWQRWTQRHHAAIHIFAGGNVLVGNCRVPASGQSNFVMKDYKLHPATKEGTYRQSLPKLEVKTQEVTFDYDNRGGIFVNSLPAGKALNIWNNFGAAGNTSVNIDPDVAAAAKAEALQDPDKARPWAFAKGLVIRYNYVYCTGAGALKFSGDGTVCSFNVIRYAKDVIRPTARGYQLDSFTNNNRAIEMRGYRWTVEGNDYEVHSNLSIQGGRYGDGEGLMHEAYDNCDIRQSKLIGNRGNRYLCIWRVPCDGLEVRGNKVEGGINVLGCTNLNVSLPVKHVHIVGNTTIESGISITGRPAEDIVIKDNRFQAATAGATASKYPGGLLKNQIINESLATLEGNQGYEEITRDPKPPKAPKPTP